MSKVGLFEFCHKKPMRLIKNFQETLNHAENKETVKIEWQSYNIGKHAYNISGIIVDGDINDLVRLIRSRWFCIQDIVLNNNNVLLTDVLSSRDFLKNAFDAIIHSLLLNANASRNEEIHNQTLRLIQKFSSSIVPIAKLNENIVLKIKTSRSESCLFYHYFHSLLEVYYYIMMLHGICGSKVENIEKHLEIIMTNLLLLFTVNIKSHKSDMCICVTYFWLAIQLLTERSDSTNSLFWKVFNKVLIIEDPLVSLSLLNELSSIQKFNWEFEEEGIKSIRIKSNYYFLELKVKELLSQANSDSLIIGFRLIKPLICDLWLHEGRIEILQIIWEFYSKRLNVSNKSCSNISALNFIETLDTVLHCSEDCTEDFELFVGLLLYHLREYPMQWGKMKGRIYSQLGPNKVKDLTDIGIRHVMILFLALSSIYFKEVEKKILAFLDNLPKEKKYSTFVWNMYAALVLKYVRDGYSIEKITPPILQMLQEASTNQKLFYLVKDFIKNLESIVNHSANMQLHQWLLFGPWLERYQSICYFADLNNSLNVIILLLEKCSNADSWSLWEHFFRDNVYANLKQLATSSNPPPIIGKIAGKLALCYTSLANEAFTFFNSDIISPKIALMFLEVILDSYPDSLILTPQQENVILHSWVKICFLTMELQCELTRNVVKVDIFPPLLKNHLKTASEPMEAFIEYLGNDSQLPNVQTKNDILKLCELAFNNLDTTLSQYLSNPDNDQVVFKIYKYVSLIFLNCGNLIYNRNKPVTILTKLVQVLLLPMDFLVGKKSWHNFVLNGVKRTWPTFFDAFITLNSINDTYLERTMKDMVVKYLPYFPTTDSPIVNCLDNLKMAQVILDKISNSYFKAPVKESDANLLKALKIVSDVAKSTTSVSLFKLVVNKTLHGLFELVIFHSQRSSAIGVIKHITSSPLFSLVNDEFRQTVLAVTEKNMALNTINYFQLLICLAKFTPDDIKHVFDEIKMQVGNVERLRGVGFDKTLRLHLERLESSLQNND